MLHHTPNKWINCGHCKIEKVKQKIVMHLVLDLLD